MFYLDISNRYTNKLFYVLIYIFELIEKYKFILYLLLLQ